MSAPASALKSKARGAGLEAAAAGVRAEFEIALFDEFGNPAEIFRHGYKRSVLLLVFCTVCVVYIYIYTRIYIRTYRYMHIIHIYVYYILCVYITHYITHIERY